MYNVPVYRIRAYIRGLKRPRQVLKKKPLFELHLKKAEAELRVTDGFAFPNESVRASIILNELTPRGLSLYATTRFQPGQQIAMTMEEPKRFYAKGRVVSCEHVGVRPTILSEKALPFRIQMIFEYQSIEEILNVKSYCQEIAETLLMIPTDPWLRAS